MAPRNGPGSDANPSLPIPPALIDALQNARRVVAMTGSGVSAESGVPTFRDAQTGIWAKFRPEDLATPEAFLANPKRVWDWYTLRRDMVAKAQPNAGHIALVRLESMLRSFLLITQNVDGLHQRAGSSTPIEFHGNIERTLCFDEMIAIAEFEPVADGVPVCPRCGGLLRPGVVWFGEAIPTHAVDRAEAACAAADLFMSIGTSSLVYPAAGLAETAMRAGATIVEINVDVTPLTSMADFSLRGPSGQILPALVDQLTHGHHDNQNDAR